ncbi:MAG: hypothetical protein V1898_02955 [Patescibacteria group bacterium]
MNIFRWIIAFVWSIILATLIFTSIPLAVATYNLAQPEQIKSWISQTGIYENIFDVVLNIAEIKVSSALNTKNTDNAKNIENSNSGLQPNSNNDSNDNGESLNEYLNQLKDPESDLYQLARIIITPEKIKNIIEKNIDNVYAWLDGEQPNGLVLEANLIDDKQQLAEFLKLSFREKLNSLPVCDADYIRPADFSVASTPCRPADFSETDMEKFMAEINNPENQEIVDKLFAQTILSQTVVVGQDHPALIIFYTIKLLPWIVLISVIIIILQLLAIIPHKFWKLPLAGGSLLFPGFMLSAVSLFSKGKISLLEQEISVKMPSAYLSLVQKYLFPLMENIYHDLLTEIVLIAVIFCGVGIMLIILGLVLKHNK